MTRVADQMTCRELVELVTGYLEDALSRQDRQRFEEHLRACDGCRVYLEQMRVVIETGGRIDEESLEPPVRDALLDAFRGWRRAR